MMKLDALVSQSGELLRHVGATFPVIGTDAAVGVGVLARRNANEGNIPTLEHRGHRFQVGERRREYHTVDARLANMSSDILGECGSVIVARLHHDLIFRRAASLDDARQDAGGVVAARNIVKQAQQIGAIAPEPACGRVGMIVELLDRPQHSFADLRLHALYVVDDARDCFYRHSCVFGDINYGCVCHTFGTMARRSLDCNRQGRIHTETTASRRCHDRRRCRPCCCAAMRKIVFP